MDWCKQFLALQVAGFSWDSLLSGAQHARLVAYEEALLKQLGVWVPGQQLTGREMARLCKHARISGICDLNQNF
eukprot:6492212-Amphidinium_carterae.4